MARDTGNKPRDTPAEPMPADDRANIGELRAIAAECARQVRGPYNSHGEELFDAEGLPKSAR